MRGFVTHDMYVGNRIYLAAGPEATYCREKRAVWLYLCTLLAFLAFHDVFIFAISLITAQKHKTI